ncbi:PX domain-containing protein [Meloidogyne graminicola]|uniref:PX domain-containing protein n=1 Tax=Meloidogyne graminicola TaxID=189291 RepID=A0A8T0A564_9BILA|nr:PX domain-containing protein [Meloidogyne graminicola]
MPPITGGGTSTITSTIYPQIPQKQEPSAPIFDPWDNPNFTQSSTFASKNNQQQLPTEIVTDRKAPSLDDDFDDDWSDEDEEVAEFTSASHSINDTAISNKIVARSRSTGPETSSMTKQQQITSGGTTRIKNLNRFTNFVKTGMEGYILSTAKFNSAPVEQPQIILDSRIGGVEGGIVKWNSLPNQYTCMVTKPKKETKLKGLKSFIAYSLTCSATGIQVARRYKQFDWLHLQLSNKYLIIPIPPLPEKQVSGRWEEDLIEHRRSILQLWVNKICRHPVLSQSEVWRHFMSCTDEAKWKKGKRLAEKDEYVGGNFFSSITVPDVVLDVANVGTTVERFSRLSRSLDESCRKIYEQVVEAQKRMAGPYKANWQKMAAAFDSLGQSLDIENRQTNNSVQNAIKTSAHVLHKIGEQHEEHGRKDLEQLLDFLFVSKGTFSAISDVVNVHKSAFAKIRENERYQNEGKISAEDAENIRQKVDVCSYAMLAEINHQQTERDLDFSTMFGSFFSQQAAFYHNIGNQLTHLATLFKPAK